MFQTLPYNQGGFIGPLPAPNNMGVCFSLSVHWLANDCEDVMLQSIEDAALPAYGVGSPNRVNQIQSAANMLAAGQLGLQNLVAIVQAAYPNVHQVAPTPPGGPIALSFGNLFTQFGHALHDNSIVWLQTAAGGRGHVVALNRRSGRFFDANTGTYDVEMDLYAEVASYIMHEYGNTYTHFQVFSFDIH